ncbi:lytic murein transglycosylase [Rhodoferax sp. PAMC 29310]|uniref:lytic murein transglycosylase n=1 Tax=Rhodoferax sp. PAMC 29310 TaxID=2822760 RepID=UPI001B32E0DA|nr:lytic murein transglycosylase [Rhodoferax sp. PAMC 29310]
MHTHSRPSPQAPRWVAPALLTLAALGGCASAPPVEALAPVIPAPVVVAAPAPEPEIDSVAKFARWVAEFSVSARAAGITEATLHQAFDTVRLIPHVITSDKAQPEFTRTVWAYLDTAVSPQRVARGQTRMRNLPVEVDGVPGRYGVPMEILAAIWGMESNYGSFMGDIPTIDALATLGFEGRREDWARGQLLAALKILQSGDIARVDMIGSWAGAMGQTQFLPSNYLAYAVDADGDGRRDIWGSLPDVMASTANFLTRSGWQRGQPWGVEVRLPTGFDYARADTSQPASNWAAEGVQSMDGETLPALTNGTLLLPAGARGPVFLVGVNFRTILRYNNSTSYALGVSLLAQRLAGGPAVQTAWPRDLQALTRTQLKNLQTALNTRGFDSGTPDGIMGPATRSGIRDYQRSLSLPADGYPTLELLQRLQ